MNNFKRLGLCGLIGIALVIVWIGVNWMGG